MLAVPDVLYIMVQYMVIYMCIQRILLYARCTSSLLCINPYMYYMCTCTIYYLCIVYRVSESVSVYTDHSAGHQSTDARQSP